MVIQLLLLASVAKAQLGLPSGPQPNLDAPVALDATGPAAPAPTELKLSDSKNAGWGKGLNFTLNGRTATIAFVLARGDKAYAAISSQDSAPRLFLLRGLYWHDKSIRLNGKDYKLSLSGNVIDNEASTVDFSGGSESASFSVRQLLAGSYAVGVKFMIGANEYRASCYDEIVNQNDLGAPDTARQNVALMIRMGPDDIRDYVLPFEDVPIGRMMIHVLPNKDRVGLARLDADRLALFPNP